MVARKARIVGAVAFALLVMFGVGTPAYADPHDDKQRVDRELAQVEAQYEDVTGAAKSALAAYQAAAAQLPIARDRLARAQVTVIVKGALARQAEHDAVAATASADAADAQVAAADRDLAAARDAVSQLTAEAYQGSGILGLNALLESQDPGEMADAVTYLDQLAGARTQAMAHFDVARAVAVASAAGAHRAREAATRARADAQAALAAAQDAQAQAQADSDAVQALVDKQAAALAAANAQKDAVLAHYTELKAEAAQIEAQLAALARQAGAHGNPPGLRPGAILLMPVRNAWKSSDFGMRYDPYYHVWQLHAGVDLAAPGGSPIYAAMAGRVVWAAWRGGNGSYTCIDHGLYQGRDLTTCYAHQSRFLVSPGQYVQRGQEIGLVGSTGASTGYHLHFEVRLNGVPTQPLDWLPACLC